MIALMWLGVVVVASFGLGRRLLRACGVDPAGVCEELTWSVSLGLGACATLLFALGLVGLVYRGLILVLTVVAIGVSLPAFERWLRSARAAVRQLRSKNRSAARSQRRDFGAPSHETGAAASGPSGVARYFVIASLGLAGIAALAALLGALTPPTAGDALCYHLELPKVYLSRHRIMYLPDSANSTYPLLMEMLFLWGLALDGGVLAQLFHWLVGLLLAGATYGLAVPVTGRRGAWLAMAVVLLVPGVSNQMNAPLNDLAVALYATLALSAVLRGFGLIPAGDDRRESSATGWMTVAGATFGFALGTKYVALLLVPSLALVGTFAVITATRRREPRWRRGFIVPLLDRPKRKILHRPTGTASAGQAVPSMNWNSIFARPKQWHKASLLRMTVVALAVGGPWYVRAAVHTGNPVYPFLSRLFGSGEEHVSASDKTPLAPTAAGLLTSPWKITMHPQRFGGRAAQLGVLFLAVLPGLFWVRPERPLTVLLLAAAIYYIMWFFLRQNLRFLLPTVPVLATAVGWVIVRGLMAVEVRSFRMPRLLRGGLVGVLGLVLSFQALIALARVRETAAVAVGIESADAFLRAHEPTYAVARFARESLPHDAVILSQDYRGFYFDQPVVRENVFRRRTRYPERVGSGDEAVAWLRGQGFTHALLVEASGPSGIRYDRTLQHVLGPRLAELPCRLRHEFVDSDGAVRTYRLLELRLPSAGAGDGIPRTAGTRSQGPS